MGPYLKGIFPVILIIVFVIDSSINSVLSQQLNGNGKEYQMYVKAGIELNDFSNVSIFKSGHTVNAKETMRNFVVAMGVMYTRILEFELQFKSMDKFYYGYREPYQWLADGTKYYVYGNGSLTSGYINLRANYFVNEDRQDNPIYFIGALNFGIQNVENSESKEYPGRIESTVTKYSRLTFGPEAGLGIYVDLGVFNFVFETTFCGRITHRSGDKKYTENSITLSFSPVLKL